MTLIELLMTMAIASVTIAVAVSVFVAMLNMRRRGERTIEVINQMTVGLSTIELDATNAGFRFPSASFAVRVVNNVTASTSFSLDGLGGEASVTTSANCGPAGWGLVPGSDVVEFAQGYEGEAPGVAAVATASTFVLTGSSNPLTNPNQPAAIPATKPIVLFTNGSDMCLGSVTSGVATPSSSVTFSMLKPDFTPEPSAVSRYPNCPANGMRVYRLGRRSRYMVCQPPPADTTTRPALYAQLAGEDGAFSAPFLLEEGVADLQVAPRVLDPGLNLQGDCTALATGQTCSCNLSGPCTGSDLNHQAPNFDPAVTNSKSHTEWVKGLTLGVTAVSTRNYDVATKYTRPPLLDHAAAGGPGDGNLFYAQQKSVVLSNLTSVTP